jgi:hypothetical protein
MVFWAKANCNDNNIAIKDNKVFFIILKGLS